MTPRQFRLATVLRARRLQEDRARAAAMAATRRAATAAALADERATGVAVAAQHSPEKASRFVAWRVVLGVAATEARTAQHGADAAHAAAEEERERWRAGHRRVSVLEALEERHRDVVRSEDAKVEQSLLDESAIASWVRRP